MITTRPANIDDARAIAEINVTTWQSAYLGLVEQELLDGMSVDQAAAWWRGQLIGGSAGSGILVALAEDSVVGYGSYGPSRDEDATSATGEVLTIYVLPDLWSRGVGQALLAEMDRQMVAAGFEEAMLWVLAGNERGMSFYKRQGWAPDGAEKDQRMAGATLHEVRYRRSLV